MAETETASSAGESERKDLPKRLVRAVTSEIPATIVAIVAGAIVGGFMGLAAGPLAPFGALAGAVLLGTPVAAWEYVLRARGESAQDYLA